MDTVESDKETSGDYPQLAQQQHDDLNDEDVLPTSIADIEDILQYEGEEVTIDSQQTTANVTDDDADVYLEISSADGGNEAGECTVSHTELTEHVNENSLDDEMVIVEESTTDFEEHTTTVDAMKVDSVTGGDDERVPSYEVVEEKELCLKFIGNEDDRRTVIMNIKTADDRGTIDTKKSGSSISKNQVAPTPELICGHTVNLLNNNKILIKSVKTTKSASASPILGKDEMSPITMMATATTRCEKIDEKSMHSNAVDSSKCRPSCDANANANAVTSGDNVSGALKVSATTMTATSLMAVAAAPLQPTTSTPKLNREFEMLTKTVNESKVLTEFIIDQSTRGRRSLKASTKRKQQLIPNTSMGSELSTTSVVAESRTESPLADARSRSKESDKSGTSGSVQSGAGTHSAGKRSTRSQNSDFSAKQRRFLKGIQQITRGTDDESENSAFDDDEDDIDYDCDIEQTKQPNESDASFAEPKIERDVDTEKMSVVSPSDQIGNSQSDSDTFCWRCHQGECQISCSTCIRAYHFNCVKVKQSTLHEQDDWQCPECIDLLAAENDDKKKFDAPHLCRLLKFAMDRILIDASSRQFQFPFDKKNYPEHVKHTIDLRDIEQNVESMRYTTTEAFLTDIKWILHNCYVCCSHNYKLMGAAKSLLKVCKQEMFDIETCAECYLNANTMVDNWFTEVCAKPHLVLWAKLKGFPYWPAKAMTINAQLVDVRFFGDHDRAFVPAKDCYLYSRQDPNPPTNKYKRNTIADCVKEVDIYIENIIAKFGAFNYAELKTPFNPYNELQHLVDMIPGTRSGRPRRRSTAYKSDLRLCIVKTADNHLSIVKKCSDRSPMTSKVIDLVDENSSTPPPHASTSSGKKRSSETKSKSNKLSPRNASNTAAVAAAAAAAAAATANEENESRHKTYQVLRRKSMAVEREQHKKVSAVILKRKSISVARAHELDSSLKLNDDDDVSVEIVPTKRSKSTAAIGKKDKSVVADVEIIPKTSSSKKQKRSHEHATTTPAANDPNATNASNTSATVTAAMVTTTANVTNATNATNVTNATSDQTENDQNVSQKADTETEKSETVDEAEPKEVGSESILTSVGLSRVVRKSKDEIEESIASSAIDEKTEDDAGTKCATVDEHNLGLRLSKETIEVDAEPPVPDKMSHRKSVSGKSPKIALVPFIELKEEPKDDDITDAVPKDGETDVTPETNEVSAIKTERALLDDSVMIIDEDPAPKSSPPASVSRLIENIRRGAIAVRDIEKMTNRPSKSPAKSATEAQRARKTFPRGLQLPAAMSNGVTSRGRTQSSSKRLPAMNNMVYIPLDGNSFSRSEVMPSISGPKLTSQPPPLTIVGSTPPTVSSSNITNLCINGPPPLSVAGASLLINQAPTVGPVAAPIAQMSSTQQQAAPIQQQVPPPQPPPQPQPQPQPPPAYSLAVANSRPFSSISSGMLTEQLASAVTETITRAPPKLTSRPTAPLRSDGDTLFPSEAGSVCRTLMENAHRMTDFFRSVIEDTLSDIANTTNPEAKIKLLEMELEKTKFAHAKEIVDLKANTDTLLNEMKKSMEKERMRTINETRKQCEMERIRSIEETKKKQWCINCGKEAQFYCCWNTSYCDYPCQLQHWSKHTATCNQVENNSSEGNNHRRNNLNTMAAKQAKHQQQAMKESPSSPAVNTSNRPVVSGMRNVFQKNSLLQKFNQFPTVTANHASNQRQVTTRTLPPPNQQCYAILSHPGTYEVFNAKPNANFASASVSLSTMRNANTIIVSSPTAINATQVTPYPLHSATMPPPLAASKTKQINTETIVIPSD